MGRLSNRITRSVPWAIALCAMACHQYSAPQRGDPECDCLPLDETPVANPPTTGVRGRLVGIIDGPCMGGCRNVSGGGSVGLLVGNHPAFLTDAGRAGVSAGGYFAADLTPGHSYEVCVRSHCSELFEVPADTCIAVMDHESSVSGDSWRGPYTTCADADGGRVNWVPDAG